MNADEQHCGRADPETVSASPQCQEFLPRLLWHDPFMFSIRHFSFVISAKWCSETICRVTPELSKKWRKAAHRLSGQCGRSDRSISSLTRLQHTHFVLWQPVSRM
jgi:hypothetical protein